MSTDVSIFKGRHGLPAGLIVSEADLEMYRATGEVPTRNNGLNASPRAVYDNQ